MDNIDIFNKWWKENRKGVYEQKDILQAGDFFIAQSAFIAGRKSVKVGGPAIVDNSYDSNLYDLEQGVKMKKWEFNENDVKGFLYRQDNHVLIQGLTELELAEDILSEFAKYLDKISKEDGDDFINDEYNDPYWLGYREGIRDGQS